MPGGRPRTPTRVLQMRGTHRRDRHGDPADEPQLELLTELPPPPGFLDEVAVYEWYRIGPELVANGLLAKADMAAFTAYCASIARAVEAEKAIKARGMTLVTPQGFEQARPEVAIARQCWAEVRKFAQEFGLTPSARTRVRPTGAGGEKKPDDPWSALG